MKYPLRTLVTKGDDHERLFIQKEPDEKVYFHVGYTITHLSVKEVRKLITLLKATILD